MERFQGRKPARLSQVQSRALKRRKKELRYWSNLLICSCDTLRSLDENGSRGDSFGFSSLSSISMCVPHSFTPPTVPSIISGEPSSFFLRSPIDYFGPLLGFSNTFRAIACSPLTDLPLLSPSLLFTPTFPSPPLLFTLPSPSLHPHIPLPPPSLHPHLPLTPPSPHSTFPSLPLSPPLPSHHLTPPHPTSPHLTSPHPTPPHLTSPPLPFILTFPFPNLPFTPTFPSPHLTSPHLISPHLISPHLPSPHLPSPPLPSPPLPSPPLSFILTFPFPNLPFTPTFPSPHLTSPHLPFTPTLYCLLYNSALTYLFCPHSMQLTLLEPCLRPFPPSPGFSQSTTVLPSAPHPPPPHLPTRSPAVGTQHLQGVNDVLAQPLSSPTPKNSFEIVTLSDFSSTLPYYYTHFFFSSFP